MVCHESVVESVYSIKLIVTSGDNTHGVAKVIWYDYPKLV